MEYLGEIDWNLERDGGMEQKMEEFFWNDWLWLTAGQISREATKLHKQGRHWIDDAEMEVNSK